MTEGKDTVATSGIVRECADPSDLTSGAPLQNGGSGEASSSERDEESRESEEDRGGIVAP